MQSVRELIEEIGATDQERGARLQMSDKSIQRLRTRLPSPVARLLRTEYGRLFLRKLIDEADRSASVTASS